MEEQLFVGPGASTQVRVFGGFAVVHGDRVTSVVPRMLRSLLGVLVVNVNTVVSADRLVDDLWHDAPPNAPAAGLQAYVSNLRKILEPDRPARTPASVLLTKDPGYSLWLEPMSIDVTAFEAGAAVGRDALARSEFARADEVLGQALALWTGSPFAELADEPWAQSTAVRLGELRAGAVEDRMEAWLEMGRHEAAIGVLQSATETEPWRERGWELLLIALYRCQRQADALRTFQECRGRFRDELGLEPGPQLQSLERQILEHAPALAAPVTPHRRPLSVAEAAAPIPVSGRDGFVGRRIQLARLHERIAQLQRGGGLVALVGEAGIGKSTFADRLAADAASSGIAVAQSKCHDSAPPLWPWLQLIQGLDADGPCAAKELAEQTLRGDVHTTVDERSAVFGAYQVVLEALREAAARTPLMLFIDDVHLADPATMTLLTLIAGELASMPVLVIVAARDDEGDRSFADQMADLLSRRGAERVTVRGLDPEDVAMFARRFPEAEQSDDLTAALHERTAGNPYFLTQLARLLSSTAGGGRFTATDVRAAAIPDDLRGVLNRRISRLPAETQSVLAVAAITGREADLIVVERAAGLDNEELMLALEPAIAAGLLTELDDRWACRFVHPLVHEVVTSEMSRLRRARLHSRVARALLAMDTRRGEVTEIAYHLLEAGPVGEPDAAIDYARRAARRSASQGIWSESVRLLRSALALADTVSTASPETYCDLLIELGESLRWSGDAGGSHAVLETAISRAFELGDARRLAMAAVAFGAIRTWGTRNYGLTDPAVIDILQRQLETGGWDDALRVRLLCTLGVELHYTERARDGLAHIAEGVALARSTGDNELLGAALVAQCFVTRSPDHLADHRHAAQDVLALAGRGISHADELTARIHLLSEHLRGGDFGSFESDLARCRDAASRLHSNELDAHLAFSEAGLALLEGRWDDADRLCDVAYEALRITSSPGAEWSRLAGLVATRRTRGMLHEIAADLASTRARSGYDAFRPFDVLAVLEADGPERARTLIDRAPSSVRRDWTWFFAIGGWAEVATVLGVPDPAAIYDELLPFAGDIAIAGSGLDAGGPIDGVLAGLAERLGRLDDARRHARASLQREQQLGIRAWEPRSRAILQRLG